MEPMEKLKEIIAHLNANEKTTDLKKQPKHPLIINDLAVQTS